MDILGAANFKSGDFRSRDFLNNMSQQLNHGRFQKTILAFAKALDTTTASKYSNKLPCRLQHQNTIVYPVES